MFKRLKAWRRERHHRQFLIREARHYLEELGMGKPGDSDHAVLTLCVGIGVGTLGGMALAKKLKKGTDKVIFATFGEGSPAHRLDG